MSRDCLEIFEVTCVFVYCLRTVLLVAHHLLSLVATHSAARADVVANQP